MGDKPATAGVHRSRKYTDLHVVTGTVLDVGTPPTALVLEYLFALQATKSALWSPRLSNDRSMIRISLLLAAGVICNPVRSAFLSEGQKVTAPVQELKHADRPCCYYVDSGIDLL